MVIDQRQAIIHNVKQEAGSECSQVDHKCKSTYLIFSYSATSQGKDITFTPLQLFEDFSYYSYFVENVDNNACNSTQVDF